MVFKSPFVLADFEARRAINPKIKNPESLSLSCEARKVRKKIVWTLGALRVLAGRSSPLSIAFDKSRTGAENAIAIKSL